METAQTENPQPQTSEEEIAQLENMITPPTPPEMENPTVEAIVPPPPPPINHLHKTRRLKSALPVIMLVAVLAMGIISAAAIYSIANLNQQVTSLQTQVSTLKSIATSTGTVATSYTDLQPPLHSPRSTPQ